MIISEAQAEIRRAYVGGGPGAIISSLVWFAAAFALTSYGQRTAYLVLFFGGMLIFPLGKGICALLFRRQSESPGNPLGMTALEATLTMTGGLLAGWLFLEIAPEYAFPMAAIAVGTHYFVFKTCYGDRTYWLMGGLITLVGLAMIFALFPVPGGVIIATAVIELVFGVILTVKSLRSST